MAHIVPVQVRFADCDAFNHVNNAVYLTYAEQARIHYFDDFLGTTIDWKAKGLILAKAEVNYLKPILLHDKIEIETKCIRIGTKSITLAFSIRNITTNLPFEVCNGETILVAFDYLKNNSMLVPTEWKTLLQ